jgi:hypothetical protein
VGWRFVLSQVPKCEGPFDFAQGRLWGTRLWGTRLILRQWGLKVFPVSISVLRRERMRGQPSAQEA